MLVIHRTGVEGRAFAWFETDRIMEIELIDPETAFKLYIAEKETLIADATVSSHKSRLGFLLRWCEERDIESLNNLTGQRLLEYRP